MALAGFAPYMTYRFLSQQPVSIPYNSMGTEQEAKSALNRPVPTPGKPQGGEPEEGTRRGCQERRQAWASGSAGGGPNEADTATVLSGRCWRGRRWFWPEQQAPGVVQRRRWGPIAAGVVAGAAVVKAAATAGPKAGQALAGQADQAASGAEQTGQAPVTPHAPPPSGPLPKTPDSSPPPPSPEDPADERVTCDVEH